MILEYCRSNNKVKKKKKGLFRSFSHFWIGSFVFLVLTCSRLLIYFGN